MLESSDVPRRAWAVMVSQSLVILFLSGWLVDEYLNNPFMGQYLNQFAPTVFPILSLLFGVTAAMIATTLYVRVRRARAEGERAETTRIARRTSTGASRRRAPTGARQPASIGSLPMPKIIVTGETSKPEASSSAAPSPPVEKQEESPPAPQAAQPSQSMPPSQREPVAIPQPSPAQQSQGEAKES